MPTPAKKVLILSLSGIGNFLMHSVTIAALKKDHPNWHLTTWVAPRGTQVLAAETPAIDHSITAPIDRPFYRSLRHLIRLARGHYDIALMLSPGQRWKGAAYMAFASIPVRLAHTYPHLGNRQSPFLLTQTINEDQNLHDIEQNLNLLTLVSPTRAKISDQAPPTHYAFAVPQANQQKAQDLIRKLSIPIHKTLVGIHPGSAPHFAWKRWPVERFARVGQSVVKQGAHIVIFGGSNEASIKKSLQHQIGKSNSTIIKTDLLTTAALLKECQLLIANDSGLMHLAAAVGTRTFGLFGPTNEAQTGPRGIDSHVIRAPGTKPVYHTEQRHDFGSQTHPTLLALTPQFVLNAIAQSIAVRPSS